ncbi:hypothetical protein [Sphingobacterium paramultivorum]|uniref:hypothetical protein n=1 Tax=Sphingobacterium paramultivorum TaxID=2886510 RepID=UPI00129D0C16|nr:hypothetical protein [Sphingobacterium paramultivorum]
MKNELTLHEAIAKVLSAKKNKMATYDEIAIEIEKQELLPNRKGNTALAKQIYLRTSLASSSYKDTWFEVVDERSIKSLK